METILEKVERLEQENEMLKKHIVQFEKEKDDFIKRSYEKFSLLKESFEQNVVPCKTCATKGNETVVLRSKNSKLLEEILKLKQELEKRS